MPTEKRIVATGFAIVSNMGGPSDSLGPGDFVVFDEENVSHKAIEKEIASGKVASLVIEEVDTDEEQQAKEDLTVFQEELEHAQARAEAEEVRQAQIQAGEGLFDPSTQTVAQVLEYMRQASPEEAERVQRMEAATDRNSKQVADFEAKSQE
jgi:phosphoribosylformylglycinamidine (FGAM) synthase PurS component